MKIILCISIIITFLKIEVYSTINYHQTDNEEYNIFLVKQRWHTGIVFKVADIDTIFWPEIRKFNKFEYVDIGWGDSAFYQNPDFSIELAALALFTPTSSTLRVYGFNLSYENLLRYYDNVIGIKVDRKRLNLLSKYISETYFINNDGNCLIYKSEYNGNIIFYKANGRYDIFNTCNTWIARGLNKIGFEKINSHLILSEELFRQASQIGKILK